jgi:hypothetical protein
MARLKKAFLPLLILITVISLVIGFRAFVMSNIIEPITIFFWAVWRLISSVDQNTYWMFLILVCVILVIYLTAAGRQRTPSSAYHETNTSLNRIEYWHKLIEDASLGDTERDYLRDNLLGLLNAASNETQRLDSTLSTTTSEPSSLPAAVQKFLYPSKGKNGKGTPLRQMNFFFLAPKWLRRWLRKTFFKDHTLIDHILQTMEKQLELSNEK